MHHVVSVHHQVAHVLSKPALQPQQLVVVDQTPQRQSFENVQRKMKQLIFLVITVTLLVNVNMTKFNAVERLWRQRYAPAKKENINV